MAEKSSMRASASMASLATPRLMLRRILEVPTAYAILAPMLMLLGAATTIIAPIILNPAQFIDFSLAMAVFQYLCYFDFGMARLTDRHFSQPNSSAALYRDLTVTRLILAGILLIGLLCLSPLIGTLFTLAGIGGVFFMLTLGQMAYHRARSNI
jgi:hypothetical protein